MTSALSCTPCDSNARGNLHAVEQVDAADEDNVARRQLAQSGHIKGVRRRVVDRAYERQFMNATRLFITMGNLGCCGSAQVKEESGVLCGLWNR